MKRIVLLLVLSSLPLLGGCKTLLVKGAVRLALGPEQAEKLDPLAQMRRKLRESAAGQGQTGAVMPPVTAPGGGL